MSQDVFQVRFLKKEQLAKNTWRFFFEKPFTFVPGQFITVFLGKESRDFTVASSPLDEHFSLVTKEGISDFKKELFSLPEGSVLSVTKPSGGFTISEKETLSHVFLAGGIGVTPFYSMLRFFHEKQLPVPMTLFVSFSKKEDTIFLNELLDITKNNSKIRIVYSLSQDTWDKEHGRISEELIKKHVGDFKNKKYLIAGGEEMVEDMQKLLQNMGVDESKIRVDIFTGY